jgi:vancomycin aglycone glucosyltransferase
MSRVGGREVQVTRSTEPGAPRSIALVAEGTRGDLHPVLALGQRLAARGHRVRVCGPPDFAGEGAAHGLDYRPVGRDVREFLALEARALHGGALAVARAGQRHLQDSMEQHFRELPAALDGAQVVVAAGTQTVAASLAEAMGARYHYVAYYPALIPTGEAPPAFLPQQRLPRWANRLAWWVGERFLRHSVRGPLDAGRRALGLPPVTDLLGYVLGPTPLLAADPELAPPPSDTRFEVRPIGCLHGFDEAPLPGKLDAFLCRGEPPVYVGFGSMTDPEPEATTRLVLEAVERAGVRAVLSAGWAGLGRSALPETVMSVGGVCHASLFRRVAAVVHHGGAGTTTTAARAGAPQIVVPHLLDQFWWGQRVGSLGLGPPALPRRGLRAERLAEALVAVRDNELLAERAAELGERLRRALRERPDPAASIA